MRRRVIRTSDLPPRKRRAVNLLPPSIRDALVAASKLPNPDERIRAIDRISDQARLTNPQFFQQE